MEQQIIVPLDHPITLPFGIVKFLMEILEKEYPGEIIVKVMQHHAGKPDPMVEMLLKDGLMAAKYHAQNPSLIAANDAHVKVWDQIKHFAPAAPQPVAETGQAPTPPPPTAPLPEPAPAEAA